MSEMLYTLIAIPYLTTGRRLFALKQCFEVAKTMVEGTLVSLIEEAISHDTRTAAMERAWARSKQVPKARGESVNIDNRIDSLLGVIHSILSNHIAGLEPDDPVVESSKRIIEQAFPEGVRPIIHLPFEEQLPFSVSHTRTVLSPHQLSITTKAAPAHVWQ